MSIPRLPCRTGSIDASPVKPCACLTPLPARNGEHDLAGASSYVSRAVPMGNACCSAGYTVNGGEATIDASKEEVDAQNTLKSV